MKLFFRLCFLFVLLATKLAAQKIDEVFVPAINQPVQPVSQHMLVFEDKGGRLSFEDVQRLPSTSFRKLKTSERLNAESVWWCRLTIAPTFSSNNFVLGVPFNNPSGIDNGNDLADVWITSGNRVVQRYRTGSLTPVSQRPVADPINQNTFPLTLKAAEPITVFWRIQRTKFFAPPQLNFALQHKSVVGLYSGSEHAVGLVYSGIMMILFVFGSVFFAITRQKPFLWFTIMAACLGLHILLLHPANYLTQWFFADVPVMQFHSFIWLTTIFNISFLLFISSITQIKTHLPRWAKVIYTVAALTFVLAIARSLYLEISPKDDVPSFVFLVLFLSTLVIGIRFVSYKNLYMRWTGAAMLWLFSFQFLGILWNMQVLSTWVVNPWVVAQVGMMIIVFFALAYRFKHSAKEKAEAQKVIEMDELKSRFFANISHEFRTPLTLIQGPLQQIEEESMGRKDAAVVPLRYVKTMRRHTDRLLELVNQLLDLSKLDSGKMQLQVIKGDVLQMLKVLTASFESMAERKGIHYQTHFPDKTIIAFFDKDKLDKIVCNLLGNAFKYTPQQGTVSVTIDGEENRLRISVDDSGPGIPKKELDKVFDRFYQVEGTEDKGSGIGLALVKELVDLYRGQISVSSEPTKGTRFKVSLPMDKSAFKETEIVYGEWRHDKEPIINSTSLNEEDNGFIQKTTSLQLPLLLVVEDNTDVRNFICETVQQHYQVIQATNGKEGLEKALQEIPDLVVSDVMMPVLDGFGMTERLKRDERTSHIPIILLTAKAGQQHKLEGLETGADDYLLKPFDSKELLTRIQNLINQRKLLRKKFAGDIMLKPSEVSVNSADENFLTKVMETIEANMHEDDFGVEQFAREVAMSRSQLHRKLVALTGQSPSEVLRNTRLLRAKELLQKRAATPSEVAFKVGFNSHTYFSKCFKEEFGISPSEV